MITATEWNKLSENQRYEIYAKIMLRLEEVQAKVEVLEKRVQLNDGSTWQMISELCKKLDIPAHNLAVHAKPIAAVPLQILPYELTGSKKCVCETCNHIKVCDTLLDRGTGNTHKVCPDCQQKGGMQVDTGRNIFKEVY